MGCIGSSNVSHNGTRLDDMDISIDKVWNIGKGKTGWVGGPDFGPHLQPSLLRCTLCRKKVILFHVGQIQVMEHVPEWMSKLDAIYENIQI